MCDEAVKKSRTVESGQLFHKKYLIETQKFTINQTQTILAFLIYSLHKKPKFWNNGGFNPTRYA